jgi:hypothetical protein
LCNIRIGFVYFWYAGWCLQEKVWNRPVAPTCTITLGKISTRVNKAQGGVEHIAVAVVALAVFRVLDKGVGAEETGNQWVINPSIHVNEPKGIKVFMECITTVDAIACRQVVHRPALGIAAAAESIKAVAFGDLAIAAGYFGQAALVVFEQVLYVAAAVVHGRKYSKNTGRGNEVVEMFLLAFMTLLALKEGSEALDLQSSYLSLQTD